MNILDILLVTAVIVAALLFIIRQWLKRLDRGETLGCGCSCSGCPSASTDGPDQGCPSQKPENAPRE